MSTRVIWRKILAVNLNYEFEDRKKLNDAQKKLKHFLSLKQFPITILPTSGSRLRWRPFVHSRSGMPMKN